MIGSPLAQKKYSRNDLAPRVAAPFGICVHTTGSGLPAQARARAITPLARACQIYLGDKLGPAYVIGLDGIDAEGTAAPIVQVAGEELHANHVGRVVDGIDRRAQYRSGEWRQLLPANVITLWRAAWPSYAHPFDLFPTASPNEDYIGIEIVPTDDTSAVPMRAGLTFTAAQHEACAQLCAEIGTRYNWISGWWLIDDGAQPGRYGGARLVGHEDVGLLDRSDHGGGWDPGALRAAPRFDWTLVRARIGELITARTSAHS